MPRPCSECALTFLGKDVEKGITGIFAEIRSRQDRLEHGGGCPAFPPAAQGSQEDRTLSGRLSTQGNGPQEQFPPRVF